MTDLTILIAVIALALWPVAFFIMRLLRWRKKHEMSLRQPTVEEQEKMTTQELVINILKQIGCQPEMNEEGQICFKYQGDSFYIAAEEEVHLIVIWNPWWGAVEVSDDSLACLKEVVNMVNVDALVTTVYAADEEQKMIGLHSKCHTLFSPHEAHLDEYLKALLDHFFTVHDAIKENVKQMVVVPADKERQSRVKVKGFAAYKEKESISE